MMVNLIKEVTNKMKGFSHKESVAYYKDIMERAWQHVEAAETPDVKMEKFDDYMGWTMLDKDFDDRTQRTFGSGPLYVPMWWGRYDPTFRSATATSISSGKPSPSSGSSSTSTGRAIQVPNLPGSNFAASVVNGTQAFAAGAIGNLTGFTSGITNRTNPLPKPYHHLPVIRQQRWTKLCLRLCLCWLCLCLCRRRTLKYAII